MSHSYGVSLAIRDHTVLTATWHKWTHPALTSARQRKSNTHRLTYNAVLPYTGLFARISLMNINKEHTKLTKIYFKNAINAAYRNIKIISYWQCLLTAEM